MTKPVCFLLLLLATQFSKAQQLSGLDQDPVFAYVLARRISFPPEAVRAKVYTKSPIYTHFRIDSLGHIQDIVTLNPIGIKFGFEQQITRALGHLPPLKPTYKGDYIIPVLFVFIYGNGKADPGEDTDQQTGITDNEVRSAYPGQTLLTALHVKSYRPK